jgi:hypothetical protein
MLLAHDDVEVALPLVVTAAELAVLIAVGRPGNWVRTG